MNKKMGDIDYPEKLSGKDLDWLWTKPFKRLNDSIKHFKDFAHILQILNLPIGSTILDLGVGSGWTSIFLSKMGYRVTGVDISPGMIKTAKTKAEKEGVSVRFLIGDLERLKISQKFDAILIYDALHHCANEERALRRCYHHLKRRGKLLLVEPNWYHAHDKEAQEIAQKYGVLERGFTPFHLKRVLKRAGFSKIERFIGGANSIRAYGNSPREILLHLFSPWAVRFFLSYFKSQVWILAIKL